MSKVTQVTIVGFTSKVARLIAASLLKKDADIVIHGICRSIEKVDPKLRANPRVKLYEASATDTLAIRKGLVGSQVCICCHLGLPSCELK